MLPTRTKTKLCITALVGLLACGTGDSASSSTTDSTPPATAEAAPADCPPTITALPPSPLYSAKDKRLRGAAVIVVLKSKRRIMLFERGTLKNLAGTSACFRMGLAPGGPKGHKQREGDKRTPEGWYRTSDKPTSRWYGAIAIHYPGAQDAAKGLHAGTINRPTYEAILASLDKDQKPPQRTALGGEILIHGGGAQDWTLGCVAMANPRLDSLRAGLPQTLRTDVLILP